jgi:hypothetical protein
VSLRVFTYRSFGPKGTSNVGVPLCPKFWASFAGRLYTVYFFRNLDLFEYKSYTMQV